MSAPKLPALRMTAQGASIVEEGVSLDLPPSNKFSISYAPSGTRQNSSSSLGSVASPKELAEEPEPESSEADEGGEEQPAQHAAQAEAKAQKTTSAPPPPSSFANTRMSSIPEKPGPHMSRTLSMPLPSQLSRLQNPHRPSPLSSYHSSPRVPSSSAQSSQVDEVSVELADSIQLVIQTMLQISPPQVLDTTKEQFSACSLSVPTPSMSALFTAMKNINYISANMSSFCDDSRLEEPPGAKDVHNEFDVGEMLQCLGDALSGAAANSGVDLVIYHGDVGLKQLYVSGDESGISFALSHVVRQVLNSAGRGDSIELGLLVSPLSDLSRSSEEDDLTAAALDSNGPVRITVRISHKFAPSEVQDADQPKDVVTTEIRPKPIFSTLFLRRILRQTGGNLLTDLPPPEAFTSGRTCDFEVIVDRVPAPMPTPPGVHSEEDLNEPSMEQLSAFGETLKGKRVALYASSKGSFAHHLTSYLTAWGMDVTHVSPDGKVDGSTENTSASSESGSSYLDGNASTLPKPDERPAALEPPSLLFIDDDVNLLKERLQALRFEHQPQPSILNPRKRPSLSTNHRPRSSPQMARLMNFNNLRPVTPIVILHFTSLSNFKLVKDVIQSTVTSYAATGTPLPEVMIIPKPAGPRRFLTALHTAIMKPTVDPFFMPTATSPMSPGGPPFAPNSFITSPISENGASQGNSSGSQASAAGPAPSQAQSPVIKGGNRPPGSRTNSDRSTKSLDGPANMTTAMPPPPSPLAIPDNVEYFSAAAQKLGTSPSSGLVIQSPDGQTAGIYFHPRNKNASRNPSSQNMERDKGQLGIPNSRRQSASRRPSDGKKDDTVTFSSLYEAPSKAISTPPVPDVKKIVPPPPVPVGPIVASPPVAVDLPLPDVSPPTKPTSPVKSAEEQVAPEQTAPISDKPTEPKRAASDDIRKLASSPATSPGAEGASTPSRRNPPKKPPAENKETPTPAPKRGKAGTWTTTDANVIPPISVLIVDDNPINQTILSTFMRRKKIKYDLASNGQEAVQKWRSGGFHLILMDIQMPIMDGIQATKEIRRIEKMSTDAGYAPLSPAPEGRTPSEVSVASSTSSTGASSEKAPNSPYRSSVIIVALTASSLQSDRVAALAAGCNDFLTKPVSLLWLNNKIIEWGSIKALQMWADIRPEAVRSLASGQAQQARNVADKLHMPKARNTPPPARRSISAMDENAAVLALASSGGNVPNLSHIPPSPSAPTFATSEKSSNVDSTPAERKVSNQSNGISTTSKVTDFGFGKEPVASGSTNHDPKPSSSSSLWPDIDGAPHRSKSRSQTPVANRASEPPTPDYKQTPAGVPDSVQTRKNGSVDCNGQHDSSSDPTRSTPPEVVNRPPP